jgi:hypothetical protein
MEPCVRRRERGAGRHDARPSLRTAARDLVRNNPYAESAIATIADHTVGWGIVAKPVKPHPRAAPCGRRGRRPPRVTLTADMTSTGCKSSCSTVVESGEVLVRRRMRRVEGWLPDPDAAPGARA